MKLIYCDLLRSQFVLQMFVFKLSFLELPQHVLKVLSQLFNHHVCIFAEATLEGEVTFHIIKRFLQLTDIKCAGVLVSLKSFECFILLIFYFLDELLCFLEFFTQDLDTLFFDLILLRDVIYLF